MLNVFFFTFFLSSLPGKCGQLTITSFLISSPNIILTRVRYFYLTKNTKISPHILLQSSFFLKRTMIALTRWFSWLDQPPGHQKVAGSASSQGTYVGRLLGPQLGCAQEATDPCFSLTSMFLSLSLSFSFSLSTCLFLSPISPPPSLSHYLSLSLKSL